MQVAPTHNKQIPGDWLARVNFKHHIKGVWRQNTIWGAVPLAVITLWPRYNSLRWPHDFLYLPFGFHPFPLGDLWHQRSQEMPWSLGNVQLYAQSCFWRVWNKEWILVCRWQELSGFPREHVLCNLRKCYWWAPLFGRFLWILLLRNWNAVSILNSPPSDINVFILS